MVAPTLNSNVIPLFTSYRYNCTILLNFLTWLQIICHFGINIYMYYQVTRNIYSVDLVLKNDFDVSVLSFGFLYGKYPFKLSLLP